jgi:hypothetical protein
MRAVRAAGGMGSFALNDHPTEGAEVSDQEPGPSDEQHTDEHMQDLDVAQEQQDDAGGGEPGGRAPTGIIGDSDAK